MIAKNAKVPASPVTNQVIVNVVNPGSSGNGRPKSSRSCVGCLAICLIVLVAVVALNPAQRQPAAVAPEINSPVASVAPPADPVATPKPSFKVGEWVLLAGDSGDSRDGVWLAASPDALQALRTAEAKIRDPNRGPGAGADRHRLAETKQIDLYGKGTRSVVTETRDTIANVKIVSGEDFGKAGWIDMGQLSSDPNGPTTEAEAKQEELKERAKFERDRAIRRKRENSK